MSKRGKYGHGRVYQPKYKDKATGETKIVSKWYIQYYDETGKQRREPTDATTEREARTILNTKLYHVEQGTNPTADSKTLHYADLRSALLTNYSIKKLKSLEVLSTTGEKTVKGLTKLDECFGYQKGISEGMKVKDITNARWLTFIEDRRKEGVSDGTIRNSGVLLRQMFSVASSSEFKLLNPIQVPRFTLPAPPKPKTDFATKEEFDKLLKYIDERFHPCATWLFFQATRKTEASNITWGQVDLAQGVYFPNADENKTGNDEAKPLANEVIKALRGLEQGKADDRVFSEHSKKAFSKAFRQACYEAKLGRDAWQCGQCKAVVEGTKPGPDDAAAIACEACKRRSKGVSLIPMQYHYVGLTPHGLRRSTVVFYREAGVADSDIMAVTGHKSNKTFLGYSPTKVEHLRKRLGVAPEQRKELMRRQKRLTA
jgi:integrase